MHQYIWVFSSVCCYCTELPLASKPSQAKQSETASSNSSHHQNSSTNYVHWLHHRSSSLSFSFVYLFFTSGAVEHTALCFLFFPFTSFYRTNILHSLPHWNGVLAQNFLSAFTIRMQTATNMDIIYAYCNMNTKTPMHRCICRSVCLCANVRPSMNCLRV